MATSDLEFGAGDSLCHSVQFLLDCKEKGRKLGNNSLASIFMVPRVCRDHSPSSFNPRVVSIGPLHRQDKNLQEFEVQKTTYLHHLLDLSGCNPQKTLQECVHKVSRKIKLVKACYAESMIYNDEELVRMMVIDACFILDFIHLLSEDDGPFPPLHDIPTGSRTHPKRHVTMDLDRAGVNFMPNEDANWAMAMKLELPRFSCFAWFWCKPTLRMPKVTLNDDSEPVLRNLIIYEQSSLVPNYVTSYVCAMDMLIDTPDDVAKLVKSGVIANKLCSNEKAVNMINSVCKDVALLEFFYHQEWQELDVYYNSYWPNAAAGLKRTYFSSPWNMIALFAGIVLFVLTVVQTIFTIKAANPMIVIKH
ncbi:unnamed protein product [Lactuca saligna]|uniref:Uncharacterized protein n=1 Tax=Lactuca saligna TaxID=75948 RepID=A0AA35YE71_LACSI|nr:unnamed protein product [Lactuca saligna]